MMRYDTSVRELNRMALKNTSPDKHMPMGKDELGLYILPVDGSLPAEVHSDELQITHFMGRARVVVQEPGVMGKTVILAEPGSQVVIPPGTRHEIQNGSGTGDLYLWSVYVKL